MEQFAMKEPNENIGRNVRRRREQIAMTQERLAGACELTVRTIQRVEAGLGAGKETLSALASVLEFRTVDEMRKPAPPEPTPKQLQQLQDRFELIPLTHIREASQLDPFLGAGAGTWGHEAPVAAEEAELVAALQQDIGDCCGLWAELGPQERLGLLRPLQDQIDELERRGFVVGVGSYRARHALGLTFEVIHVHVSRATAPVLVVTRPKGQLLEF